MTISDFDKILQGIVIMGAPMEVTNEMVRPIRDVIVGMLPSSLLRLRPCCDLQIEAFKNDEICAVTADKYYDPSDGILA